MTRLEHLAHRIIGALTLAIIWPSVMIAERRARSLRETRAYLDAIEAEMGNPHVQASRHAR